MMDQGQEISICIKICSPGQEKRQVLKKMMFGKHLMEDGKSMEDKDMPTDKKTEDSGKDLEPVPY